MRRIKIKKLQNLRTFILIFLCIFVPYTLVYIAYFPGVFGYDAYDQVMQYIIGYNVHHPLLHTLIHNFFLAFLGMKFNMVETAVGIYIFLQYFIFCIVITSFLNYEIQKNVNKIYVALITIFIAFFPVFQIMSVTTVKDVAFTISLIAFIFTLYKSIDCKNYIKSNFNKLKLAISFILCFLFRNNARYLLFALILVYFIIYRFNVIFKIMLVSFILSFALNYLMVFSLKATNWDGINEMLSVPAQMLAYTYNEKKNEITYDFKEDIKECFVSPNINYDKYLADTAKFNLKKDNYNHFFKTVARCIKKFPFDFIKVFFTLNKGYFDILDTTQSHIYDNVAHLYDNEDDNPISNLYSTERLIDMKVFDENVDVQEMKHYIPWLEKFVFDFGNDGYLKYGFLSIFFRCSIYTYMLLFGLFFSIFKKQKVFIVMYSGIAFYFLTLLFGPCVYWRYMYPIALSVILLYGLQFFIKDKIWKK